MNLIIALGIFFSPFAQAQDVLHFYPNANLIVDHDSADLNIKMNDLWTLVFHETESKISWKWEKTTADALKNASVWSLKFTTKDGIKNYQFSFNNSDYLDLKFTLPSDIKILEIDGQGMRLGNGAYANKQSHLFVPSLFKITSTQEIQLYSANKCSTLFKK